MDGVEGFTGHDDENHSDQYEYKRFCTYCFLSWTDPEVAWLTIIHIAVSSFYFCTRLAAK